jgi:hypothetical protein
MPMKSLVFFNTYHGGHLVTYLNGKYLGRFEFCNFTLLQSLGFEARYGDRTPEHCSREKDEFDRDEKGCWVPPEDLATLEEQFARYRWRLAEERVRSARDELKAANAHWLKLKSETP